MTASTKTSKIYVGDMMRIIDYIDVLDDIL